MLNPVMACRLTLALGAGTLLLLTLPVTAAQHPASWLDRPLANWNKTGQPVPSAPAGDETTESVIADAS